MHNTQTQFCYTLPLPPDQHHISDVAVRRFGGTSFLGESLHIAIYSGVVKLSLLSQLRATKSATKPNARVNVCHLLVVVGRETSLAKAYSESEAE